MVCTACASTGGSVAVPAAPATTSAEGPADPVGVAAAADPLAPATYLPVQRPGVKAVKRLPGGKGGLTPAGQVRYEDGVAVSVKVGGKRTANTKGPGSLTGRSQTTMTVTVTNRSAQELELSSVVVTTTYGSPARTAPPVYDDGTRDLAGSLRPGSSTSADYAFAIPGSTLPLVLVVDLDETHAPAVFTGSSR